MVDALNGSGAHGKGVMAVSPDYFHTSAIRMAKNISSSDGIFYTVSLVSTTFSYLRFMNDPDLFPGRSFQ